MNKSWLIWLVMTMLVTLYAWAGSVASKSEKVGIKLERGYSTQVRVFRLAEDRLRMGLTFQGDHTRRLELGTWATRSDWGQAGTLKFDNPGTAIRVVASAPGVAPVTYEAMPTSAWGPGSVDRKLTASLSISPGVWPWPPAMNELVLHRGTNIVNIEVIAVEPPLVGEALELWIAPPLGFKVTMPSVGWLWLWFFWPVLLAIQVLWAIALCVPTWRMRRRNRQEAG